MADSQLIDREVFDWGVRLTARPFKGTEQQAFVIYSEIGNYKGRRGAEVNISFPAAARLRLLDAQAWIEAMSAIVAESRNVQGEFRTSATTGKKKAGRTLR
jgi:hypothetical protein